MSLAPELRLAASAAIWLGLYLALVLAPVLALLVGPSGPGLGFWWDLSAALGFSGLAMMGVQSVLTARFRRATAPYGIDIIYYFHRYLGMVLVGLILVHPVLLIFDNPALVSFLDPREAPPHITAGVLSVALLLVLVGASVWRKALHIEYGRWRLTHAAFAFLAVGLALVHIEGVQYYTATPWLRVMWRVFLITWLAVVAYVRLVRPWQLWQRPYRVVGVTEQRGNAWSLALRPDGHAGFAFEPGQFAWLTIGGHPFRMDDHPFSFSSRPGLEGGTLEFTIKELGDFSRTIRNTPADTVAFVDGPYGAFTMDRHPAPGFVFIAGGIGVAPIVSMLRALAWRKDHRPVLLVYACSEWDRMTFREEIDTLRAGLDLTYVPVLETSSPAWTGEHGWITRDLLDRHLPADRRERHVFVCGPEAMRAAVERFLQDLGVPLSHVHSELFDMV